MFYTKDEKNALKHGDQITNVRTNKKLPKVHSTSFVRPRSATKIETSVPSTSRSHRTSSRLELKRPTPQYHNEWRTCHNCCEVGHILKNCPYLQKHKSVAIDQQTQIQFSQTKLISKVKTQVYDNRNKLSKQKTVIKPPTLVKSKSKAQSSMSKSNALVYTVQQRVKPKKAKQVVVTRNSAKPVTQLITLSELKLRNAHKQVWQQKVDVSTKVNALIDRSPNLKGSKTEIHNVNLNGLGPPKQLTFYLCVGCSSRAYQ